MLEVAKVWCIMEIKIKELSQGRIMSQELRPGQVEGAGWRLEGL